jgi:uncharacterized membrane protein YgcG
MEEHDHSMHQQMNKPEPHPTFWQSRTGITLIVFLVIAAVLLGYEHRVHIFGSNAGTFLFLFAWIGMHFFMHSGHGGHGGHGSHSGHAGHGSPSEPPASPNSESIQTGGEKP